MNKQKDSPLSDLDVSSNSSNSNSSNSNAAELFEDLQKFYKGRANKNENKSKLFEYDDDGNLTIKIKRI